MLCHDVTYLKDTSDVNDEGKSHHAQTEGDIEVPPVEHGVIYQLDDRQRQCEGCHFDEISEVNLHCEVFHLQHLEPS